VGLGNPGRGYAATRHNVGFMVIERLAERWRIDLAPCKGVRSGRGQFRDSSVLLVEPQRYMNLSGEALVEAVPDLERDDRDAELAVPRAGHRDDVIVVHDDIDLDCGQLRIKRGGGSGGHRGVASIADRCGADFLRVRVGVGRPAVGEDAVAHVLAPFADTERDTVATAIELAADAVESLISDGIEMTMNRFNRRAATLTRAN